MDDPWANAWGESSKSVLPEPSPNWSSPSVSALHGDHEDDLSNPSWPKETSSHWAADDTADASIWGGTEAASSSSASAWNPQPSTFDKISLGGESYPDPAKASLHASGEPTAEDDRSITPSPSSPVDDEPEPEAPPQFLDYRTLTPPSHVPPPISIPLPEDPDGFGSFATASTEEAPAWTPSKPSFQIASADAAAWGGGWEAPDSATAQGGESEDEEDEWEAARRQKEMQDRHVPPELLESILKDMDALSDVLWPDKEPAVDDELDKARHIDFETLGLQTAAQKLIPEDLVLPMNGAFTKTFISKQLSGALKLTRHSSIAKSSPMAMYMVSKGSTSWEASIKARAAIAPEDVAPAGWKIVEQTPADFSADDGKKKAGGFFSFFGRKAAMASVDSIKRPGSPGSISGVSSIKAGASPRPSVDSSRSSIAPSNAVAERTIPSSPVVVVVPEANPTPIQISESKSISTISPLSETSADGLHSEATPPSAVSRFLGRFSGKSRRSASRDSLALSVDDIEFLSDVPTTSPSNGGGSGPDLDALSLMLKVPPPPLTTTLPPPLPPPPKPAQLPRIAPPPPVPVLSPPPAAPTLMPVTLLAQTPPALPPSMTINDEFDDFWEVPATKPPPQAIRPPSLPSNDPFSFFDAPPTNPSPPRNAVPSPAPEPAPLDVHPTHDDDDHWASFDVPAPQPIRPIARPPVTKQSPPPPPVQAKRSFVPIMNSSRSSTPVNTISLGTFSLPPPPAFGQPRLATNGPSAGAGQTPVFSPLAPPPSVSRPPSIPLANFGSSNLNGLTSSVSAPVVNLAEEDDDFADFLSSPSAGPSEAQPTSFVDFDAPIPAKVEPTLPSAQAVPGSKSYSNYDNFGFLDTASSIQKQTLTSSSSSPATGRKMSLPGIKSTAKPLLPSTRTSSGHARKVSREADHARTQSLLDSAAARGRWLAPPSPIPEALAPPPDSGSLGGFSPPKTHGVDGASTMQTQQAHAVASITSKSNGKGAMLQPPPAWSFPAPPSMNGSSLLPQNALKASATPSSQVLPSSFMQPAPQISKGLSLTPSPAPTQNGSKSGGLSAQDLSFFEGL